MSSEAMAWAFAQQIPPAPKLVLLALANNANKHGGQCFPALRLIAENCAPMQVRTIQNHLKWLAETAGLITITPWFHDNGRQTSNLYELCLTTTYCGEGAVSCTPSAEQNLAGEGAESCRGRVQKAAGGRVQKAAGGRVQKAAPLLNPDLNPNLRKKEQLAGGAGGTRQRPAGVCDTAGTWEAYRLGSVQRYGVEPIRDASTNAILKRLVQKFGPNDSPLIVQQYFKNEKKLYLDNRHPPNLLLRDCYGLRTEMLEKPQPVKVSGPKAYRDVHVAPAHGEACPPEVAAKLARILGRENFAFLADEATA